MVGGIDDFSFHNTRARLELEFHPQREKAALQKSLLVRAETEREAGSDNLKVSAQARTVDRSEKIVL